MKFLELADLVEALEVPSNKLDGDIAELLGIVPGWVYRRDNPRGASWSGARGDYWYAPAYTSDISAAMSLVSPEWKDWHISSDSLHKIEASIWACRSRYTATGEAANCHQGYHDNNPAIALTAAALRALAQ